MATIVQLGASPLVPADICVCPLFRDLSICFAIGSSNIGWPAKFCFSNFVKFLLNFRFRISRNLVKFPRNLV
jgi:hypothetical protein